MKSLKQLCEDTIYKKCNWDIDYKLHWLNCGLRCIPFKLYQELMANEYYLCTCKRRIFTITKNNESYSICARAHNRFHCWFMFLLEIKIKIIYKKRNNLVHLTSLLINFFNLINKFKYIYQSPNFQNIVEGGYNQTFSYYLDKKLGCLCYDNESCINFL